MIFKQLTYTALGCLLLLWNLSSAQDIAYTNARALAFEGDLPAAKGLLVANKANHLEEGRSVSLLGRIYSWEGDYEKARKLFNRITSEDRANTDAWIAAIKNELYAKNDATALGLANKALYYLKDNNEIERLKTEATQRIEHKEYPPLLPDEGIDFTKRKKKQTNSKAAKKESAEVPSEEDVEEPAPKTIVEDNVFNNRVGIRNAFTVFDAIYDPMIYSSVSYRRQTLAGSIIPRINYSNRLGKHGIQYELDFYPKFSKRFYAYINYGYSSASIYPGHKVGGDLYANLPGAFEFSAGARYIGFATKNVSVITNSLGHYRGNYYFSLRSYITPQPNNLTRISGNLLVRKYFRDGENFFGVNVGMGYSPELRQLRDGDELLAETLLYIESQRMSVQYQFTPKKSKNIYMANLGVARQELSFDTGKFFWSVSAGITYSVKF